MSEFMLIDGSLMAYRYYEAMPDLSNSSGTPTNVEYGMLRGLESLERKYPDAQLVLVWDSPKAKSEKQKIDPLYKANRSPGGKRGLWSRLERLKERVIRHRWANAKLDGIEADEVMYSIARHLAPAYPHETNIPSKNLVLLYTNDEDLLQTITDNIIVLKSHQSKIFEWDGEKVVEKFGVHPHQLPLLRAALGDKSDNLPGCGCLGRPKLAQAVREAFKVAFESRQVSAGPADLVKNIAENHVTWFGPKTRVKWDGFVASGQLHRNFELMQIRLNPDVETEREFYRSNHVRKVTMLWVEPTLEVEPVAEALAEWEIKSLRMCKEVFAKAEDDEEF
ncbi:hypothetical protein LCGC14_0401790 [marine sediment metagenome]|uniref:5'-3' exonuclease domain-containing protein n=1 Tax=marine sediment metagenome TaxID=412755 RepID=A0A0F9VIN8_9ZZZZ